VAANFLANAGFLRIFWSLNGQLGINVVGLRVPSGVQITQTLANTVGAAVKASYASNLKPIQPPGTNLIKVGLRDFRAPNQIEFLDTGPSEVGGEAAGQLLPAQIAMCITLRTALSGRSGRGRLYIPGWSETSSDASGTATTGAATAGVAFVTGIKSAVEASGMFMAVVSRPSDEHIVLRRTLVNGEQTEEEIISRELQKAGAVNDVTAIQARNNTWEQQRRRVNGRGGGAPAVQVVAQQTF
jgi:hypothetical protein